MARAATRRPLGLELVQWFVTLAAPLAWSGQFVVAYGLSVAACGAAGSRWNLATTTWQIALTAAAGLVAGAALVLSVLLFRRTQQAGSEPPEGRHRFFAYAGIGENAVFLALVLITGLGPLYHYPCGQA